MSAGKRWHDGTPTEVDEPIVPQAILSWVRELGEPNRSASPPPAESLPTNPTESPHENSLDSPETIAILLRAIEGTDLAALLEGVPLPGDVQSQTADFAESAVIVKITPDLEPPPATPPPAAAQPEPLPASPLPPPTLTSPQERLDLHTALLNTVQDAEIRSALKEQPLPAKATKEAPASPESSKLSEPQLISKPAFATAPPPAPVSPKPKPARPPEATRSKLPKPEALRPVSPAPAAPAREKSATRSRPAPAVTPSRQRASVGATSAVSGSPAILRAGLRSLAAIFRPVENYMDRAEAQLERWFLKWFEPPDPRHSARLAKPPLVAYRWILNAPQAIKIANVSSGGLYLLTDERWSEGNIISMTLQRTDMERGAPESWIAVDFVVMRRYKDGLAGAFIPSRPGLDHAVAGRATNCADRKTLEQFFEQLSPTGSAPARRRAHKILAALDRLRRAISSRKDRLCRLSALVSLRFRTRQRNRACE